MLLSADIGDVDCLAAWLQSFQVRLSAIHFNNHKILGTLHLPGDAGRRQIHIVKGRAATSGDEIMDAVLQIVLVVVIVAKKSGRYLVFFEHWLEGRHMGIVTLAVLY